MSLKQAVIDYAETYPHKEFSAYQIWQDPAKRAENNRWRMGHPLYGKTVPLVTPIPYVTKRTRRLSHHKKVTIGTIDLCGGIRFNSKQQYWIELDTIDFAKLENRLEREEAKAAQAHDEFMPTYEAYFDECERANHKPLCFDAWLKAGKPEHPRGSTYDNS